VSSAGFDMFGQPVTIDTLSSEFNS
jgi:hypothetical protein